MNRQEAFARLARRIERAAANGDWADLSAADLELAGMLPSFIGQPEMAVAERAALLALREAHDEAFARCVTAGERIGSRLSELGAARDGWLAYAHDHDLSGEQS